MKSVIDTLLGLSIATKKAADSFDATGGSARGIYKNIREAEDAFREFSRQMRNAEQTSGKSSAAYIDAARKMDIVAKELQGLTEDQRKLTKAMKDANDKLDEQSQAFGKYSKSLKMAGNVGKGAVGMFKSYASMVGAVSFSLTAGIPLLTKYNQSVFNLSRMQQVAGKGMGDLEQVMKRVTQTTVLSNSDFADFASTMSSAFRGISPTVDKMGEFASSLQKQFGPNVDVIKGKMQELLSIQDKFPALYDTIQAANEAMTDGDEKRASVLRMNAMTQMRSTGVSISTQKSMLQYMSATTKEQKKSMEVNEAIAKAKQESENALLKTMQASSEDIRRVSDAVSKFFKKLSQFPMLMGLIGKAFVAAPLLLFGKSLMDVTGLTEKFIQSLNKIPAAANATAQIQLPPQVPTQTGPAPGAGSGGAMLGGGVVAGVAAAAIAFSIVENMTADYYEEDTKKTKEVYQKQKSMFKGNQETILKLEKQYGAEFTEIWDKKRVELGKSLRGKDAVVAMKKYAVELQRVSDDLNIKSFNRGGVRKAISSEEELKKAKLEVVKAEAKVKETEAKGNPFQQSKAIDELKEAHGKVSEVSASIVTEWSKIIQNQSASLDILNTIQGAIQGAVDSSSEMGYVYQDQLGVITKIAQQQAQISTKSLADLMKGSALEGDDIISVLKKQAEGAPEAIQEVLNSINLAEILEKQGPEFIRATQEFTAKASRAISEWDTGGDADKEQQKMGLTTGLQPIVEGGASAQNLLNKYTKSGVQEGLKYLKVQQEINSIYQQNLEAQTRLMESAQFGLGASVAMLQKQVDLMKQQIGLEEESKDNLYEKMFGANKIYQSDKQAMVQDKEALLNAKNSTDLTRVAEDIGKKRNVSAQSLITYTNEYRKIQTSILGDQQKIYDLTKEMREGYLDAIREMSVGAGEFEKIIGTQTMGFSQLMDITKQVTGQDTGTMLRGGQAAANAPGMESRTGITGRYAANGIQFIDQATQESRNQNISNWQQSTENARKAIEGKRGSADGMGTIGEANVSGMENYVAPDREAKIQAPIFAKAQVEEMKRQGVGIMGASGTSYTSGAPAQETIPNPLPGVAANEAIGVPMVEGSDKPAPARGVETGTSGKMDANYIAHELVTGIPAAISKSNYEAAKKAYSGGMAKLENMNPDRRKESARKIRKANAPVTGSEIQSMYASRDIVENEKMSNLHQYAQQVANSGVGTGPGKNPQLGNTPQLGAGPDGRPAVSGTLTRMKKSGELTRMKKSGELTRMKEPGELSDGGKNGPGPTQVKNVTAMGGQGLPGLSGMSAAASGYAGSPESGGGSTKIIIELSGDLKARLDQLSNQMVEIVRSSNSAT
ncbi:MAG: hypothetical protein WC375_03625 [Methanomassiliicoccales archaeon]